MAKILYVEDDLSLSFVTQDQLENVATKFFHVKMVSMP